MQLQTTIRLAARTDKGLVRHGNEDNFIVGADIASHDWKFSDNMFNAGAKGCLLVVADGMGGAKSGDIASQTAVGEVKAYFDQITDHALDIGAFKDHMENALMSAHHAVIENAAAFPENNGMGTTMVLAWVHGTTVHICWSGDSRCYRYNHLGEIKLLTDDHSVVWEMVLGGNLTKEEAAIHNDRHIITQSLGMLAYPPKPDFRIFQLEEGDRLLLCSDGLNSMLSEEEMKMVISKNSRISSNCFDLVEAANQAGGEDNITVVMYELVEILSGPRSVITRKPMELISAQVEMETVQKPNWSFLWIIVIIAGLAMLGLLAYRLL